jgi:DNA polymerase-3 subunit gamma/tau
VGKTTCARILAKKINEDGKQREGEDFAFNIFELDAASNNSVDDIRNLIDQVRIPPQVGKYKVYIIDEVHMLSQAAFNAFLKTLEEPPKHAIFILATTEKHKIIPTILSRCQIFDFRRITVKDATAYLARIAEEQGIEAEEEALHMIAQKADGAMRDALSIFDRVVSFAGKRLSRKAVAENLNLLDIEVYFDTTDLILKGAIPELFLYFNEVLSNGFEGHHFIRGLASHFRNLMVCSHENTVVLLETTESTRERYLDQARRCEGDFLLKALDIANQCDMDYKGSRNQRLLVELCLMKLASLSIPQKKKDTESEIALIPASHFHRLEASPTVINPKVPAARVRTSEEKMVEEIQPDQAPAAEPASPVAKSTSEPGPIKPVSIGKSAKKKVSGLSLSSIRAKKAHLARKNNGKTQDEQLPGDEFTEAQLQEYWKEYIEQIEEKGQKILAATLASDIPKRIGDHTIWIELPNSTMKKEVERDQYGLIQYLKQNLNNFNIELKITVNEEAAKQYAFTPEEKYQKLREKNPTIDLLRNTFDLEL